MAQRDSPFSEEELNLAATVPVDDQILLTALRIGTQALSEFGHTVMEPVFHGQIGLSDRETALGMSFYRLLAAVHTLSDLRQPYHFQNIASCTRLICELCVDIDILVNDRIDRAVEKFHGFTRAARFSAAFKTVAFYARYPELEGRGDAEERRRLVETPGEQSAIEALCRSLWGSHKAPEHWTGLRWLEQVRLIGPEMEEDYVQ